MRSERGPSLERAPKGATRRKRPSGYAGIEPSVSTQVRHRSTCQTIGMVCERGKQDPEDDRHRALKARCEHQGQDLRLVADFGETDNQGRYQEGFHGDDIWGRAGDKPWHGPLRPTRVQETDAKGS